MLPCAILPSPPGRGGPGVPRKGGYGAGVASARPVGVPTRGTTHSNRLRRCDRWLTATQAPRWRSLPAPMAVDLGYGASPITTVQLRDRLAAVCPGIRVLGLEIDPDRVAAARGFEGPGLAFALGGFEVPLAEPGERPVLIRAFNVLRQYEESDSGPAWDLLRSRLHPRGVVVDGTCDELGRVASWVALDARGPRSLTISLRLAGLDGPGRVAERLPKALIHRNVPGQRVHAFVAALERAWARAAPHAAFGRRQRFVAAAAALRDQGWPVLDAAGRWRLGELTVAWEAVRPD